MPKKADDVYEFERLLGKSEDGEPDYMMGPSFPPEPNHDLRHLIDYRVKLLIKEDTIFELSESQLVATCCKISCKSPNLSMHIKGYENLPLVFESEVIISSKYYGTVYVNLRNYSNNQVKLPSGATLGYLILQPYSL